MNVTISDVLSAFGITGSIASSVVNALADPTSDNIAKVNKAYLANGQTPPAKLLVYLIERNKVIHPEDPYIEHVVSDVVPILVIGAIVGVLVLRKLLK